MQFKTWFESSRDPFWGDGVHLPNGRIVARSYDHAAMRLQRVCVWRTGGMDRWMFWESIPSRVVTAYWISRYAITQERTIKSHATRVGSQWIMGKNAAIPMDYFTDEPVDLSDPDARLTRVYNTDGVTARDPNDAPDGYTWVDRSDVWASDDDMCYPCDDDRAWLCDDAHYWESDGEWHTEEYEPEDDDDESGGVPEYHGGLRRWRGTTIEPLALGVELECDYGSVRNCESLVNDAEAEGWGAERDGSLDRQTGLELITSPMPLKVWNESAASVATAMIRDNSGTVPNGEHGLHVSINADGWTQLHCQKFAAWWSINSDVVTKLARRTENTWSDRNHPKPRASFKPTGHYDACSFRSANPYAHASERHCGRVEIRVFRSTNTARILRACVQLVHAVALWTKDCPLGNTRGPEAYMSIGDQMSFWRFVRANRRDYPDLEDYALSQGVPVHDYVKPLRVKPEGI